MTYLLFGIKLRLLREMMGLSQKDMARKFGIELKPYQQAEEAQHEPRSGTALSIADTELRFKPQFRPHDTRVKLTGPEVDKLFGRVAEIRS